MVLLRDVTEDDLPILFEHQLDPDANLMAFTINDPMDRDTFMAHWADILGSKKNTVKTILFGEHVAGYIHHHPGFGNQEVSYWIGKEYWGKGIATKALSEFLTVVTGRPLYAQVAKSNIASIRVLEKCGFVVSGVGWWLTKLGGKEIEEVILELS